MIYKLSVTLTLVLSLIYTLSYAVFEFKNQNTPAAAGVCVLCVIVTAAAIFV